MHPQRIKKVNLQINPECLSVISKTKINEVNDILVTSVKNQSFQAEPFNSGSNKIGKGNGLGLVWVSTISKLYNWDLQIRSSKNGTEIEIKFPTEDVS
ncbi:MAG: hypothetical protein B7Y39_02480 [Bdellovibrio sp. 28-41-41]|nr:MAG: hypothetical protein B7Y39_02480 [Bdellovibrio sp. 28-41-41]